MGYEDYQHLVEVVNNDYNNNNVNNERATCGCLLMKKRLRSILLPFCCFHVQGHLRSKLEKENDLFTSLKGKFPNSLACIYVSKCM